MVQLVDAHNFLRSIRETGYRSLAHSVAEFIDNSVQAGASSVSIQFVPEDGGTISITDDGSGMSKESLRTALQFGGSTRFNDRNGLGRFGMGLPTSSVSMAKRVDVYTWKRKTVLHTYLDIDELECSPSVELPEPKRIARPVYLPLTEQGTRVVLSQCDRTGRLFERSGLEQTKFEIRRIFRYQLNQGLQLDLNGSAIQCFDPLFLTTCIRGAFGAPYGPDLEYNVPIGNSSSRIRVRFSELPVAAWRDIANVEKQTLGISRGAGCSIVRKDREIAYGWFFFGTKRKENYDDWWRCEVSFPPELDEYFGVNHTKQQITPTPDVERLLSPDMENIARTLNARVRQEFVRTAKPKAQAVAKVASGRDKYLPALMEQTKAPVRDPDYRIAIDAGKCDATFFRAELAGSKVSVLLNPNHPITSEYLRAKAIDEAQVRLFEYAVLSAARAELAASSEKQRWWFRSFRTDWSDTLATFLGN